MLAHENKKMTETGPGTPAGNWMRLYWQPVALTEELAGPRPVVTVRLLREELVLFRNEDGNLRLVERRCPHRGAGPGSCPARGTDPWGWGRPAARPAGRPSPSPGWRTAACAAPPTAGCSTEAAAAWKRPPNPWEVSWPPRSASSPTRCASATAS